MAYFSNNRTGSVKGNDVSYWQNTPINFTTMYNAGSRFCYVRTPISSTTSAGALTMFGGLTDGNARANAIGAKGAGIDVGIYHFLRTDVKADPIAEAVRCAQNMIYAVGDLYPGYTYGKCIPMVDIEYPMTPTAPFIGDAFLDYCEAYINELKRITGFKSVFIYTNRYFASLYNNFVHTVKGAIFNKYPLWMAGLDPAVHSAGMRLDPNNTPNYYGAEPAYPGYTFEQFGGWTYWTIWQYSLDRPDVPQGAIYGSTATDIDVDVIRPEANISVLYKDTYEIVAPIVPLGETIQPPNYGGKAKGKMNTNLTNISIEGDFLVKGNTEKEVIASPMLEFHKEAVLADLIAGFVVVEPLPGKQVIIEKVLFAIDADVLPSASAQLKLVTTDATPKMIMLTNVGNLGSGSKINTDGFSYFTEGVGMMRKKLGLNIGVNLVSVVVPTAGAVTMSVYFRYV